MRTKAEKLEKGKWYADSVPNCPTFLKFSHTENRRDFYTEQKGSGGYWQARDGFIPFTSGNNNRYIPTPEDIEKYGLIDDETT